MKYVVSWQFMGPKSVTFYCLIEALDHANNLIEMGDPLHVHVTPVEMYTQDECPF